MVKPPCRFLNREKDYENAPRPDLVLLDLNIPKKKRVRGAGGD